jgi:hypothetical protein
VLHYEVCGLCTNVEIKHVCCWVQLHGAIGKRDAIHDLHSVAHVTVTEQVEYGPATHTHIIYIYGCMVRSQQKQQTSQHSHIWVNLYIG